jgi:hypothetical protein
LKNRENVNNSTTTEPRQYINKDFES